MYLYGFKLVNCEDYLNNKSQEEKEKYLLRNRLLCQKNFVYYLNVSRNLSCLLWKTVKKYIRQ